MRQIAYQDKYLRIWNRFCGLIFVTTKNVSPAFSMVRVEDINQVRQFGMNT